MRRPGRTVEWALVAAITAGAAALRLAHISQVPPDPFYDAAVRSMSLSWHNFFFGAFEPGGSVSIDKPPVDLWLQVVSVKLLGFSSTTLKLPEALAGVAAAPLLYAIVRRMWSAPAGIAAAAALAVLPIEVITARSDTMDAVMMLVILLALMALVRAVQTGRTAWLLAGAAAMGVAFDVKLLESLVALPGLAAFAYLGLPGSRGRRLLKLTGASAVYVAVALAWLTATLLFPAHQRPYAIGSTNGSAWNAAFVFNGTDRIGGSSPEAGATVYEPGRHYPTATQRQRDSIPIMPPSPSRLLARVGPLSGQRLGLQLLVALLLGTPALLWGLLAGPRASEGGEGAPERGPSAAATATAATAPAATAPTAGPAAPPGRANGDARLRMRRAAAGGLGLWTLTGVVLYSQMARLHPRYVEAFTPAVAAMLGIGVAWATAPSRRGGAPGAGRDASAGPGAEPAGPAPAGGRVRAAALALTLAVVVYYGERLLYGMPLQWWVTLAGAVVALALTLLARRAPARQEGAHHTEGAHPPSGRRARAAVRRGLAPAGATAASLVAVLAIPLGADFTAIADRVSDAGLVGQLPGAQQRPLSAYLRAHQRGAYYEVAAESATSIGSLIVQDARPVLVLTTYHGRVFTTVPQLRRLIAQGKVRYAFLNTFCTSRAPSINPACSAPARWVRAHGRDVSRAAGLGQGGLLYLLPGARP